MPTPAMRCGRLVKQAQIDLPLLPADSLHTYKQVQIRARAPAGHAC